MLPSRSAVILLAASACVPVVPKGVLAEQEQSSAPLPVGPVKFDYPSLGDDSVSALAFRGKPAVIAFVVSDTLAGQAEATIVAGMAEHTPNAARFAIVAVEPEDKRELVQGFLRFFTEKTRAPVLGAMADKDTLLGLGPFGDVRALTVVVLDRGGEVVFRKTGVVQAAEITRALKAM